MHVKEKDISLYLDNSLPLKVRERMKLHFFTCIACKRRLEEYQRLYQAIGLLEYDFPLEGMELKVINKIKENKQSAGSKPVSVRSYFPGLVYALVLFAIAGFFFYTPITNVAGNVAQNATTFMLNEWIDWINIVKWQVVDIISSLYSADFIIIFLPLIASLFLIAGGIYVFLSRKTVKKA